MSAPVLEFGLRIPLPDGVCLGAALWRPAGGGRHPCLLKLSPYTVDFGHAGAREKAEAGFAVLLVDCRGRGNSDGDFRLYDDGDDGAHAVQWAAGQPWCTGEVALFGASYAGLNQWAIAARRPAGLVAIAPVCAPMPGFDADFFQGIFPANNARWAAMVRGRTLQRALYEDDSFWAARFEAHFASGLGPQGLGEMIGPTDQLVAEMVRHMHDPAHWARLVPDAAAFGAIDIPVLSITGTADNAQRGTLEYRRRHLAARPEARHWLIVGPWNHGGLRDPEPPADAPDTAARSMLAMCETEILTGFYNWAFGRGPLPDRLASPVSIYVAGAEQWTGAPAKRERMPPPADQCNSVRLVRRRSDAAFTPPRPGTADLFRVLGGEAADEAWHLGERDANSADLSWPAFGSDVDLVGQPWVALRLKVEAGEIDLCLLLWAELPDGSSRILSTDQARLKESEGWAEHYFDTWRLGAHRLPAGTSLHLQIRILDHPGFQRVDRLLQPDGFVALTLDPSSCQLRLPLMKADLP